MVSPTVALLAYVGTFLTAGLVCFGLLYQMLRIKHAQVRWGMLGILILGGSWALLIVGYLIADSRRAQHVAIGLAMAAAVGTALSWLYLTLAAVGYRRHRTVRIKWGTITGWGVLTVLLLFNPAHGWFFSTGEATVPFTHLTVEPSLLLWMLVAGSYVAGVVGFVLLLRLFVGVAYRTGPLIAILFLAASPVALDVLSWHSEELVTLAHGPVGVAIFGVGILYGFLERFQVVQLTGDVTAPLLIVDESGVVGDANAPARKLFPALDGRGVVSLAELSPQLAEVIEEDDAVVELQLDGEVRRFDVSTPRFAADATRVGRLVRLSEIDPDATDGAD